MSAATANPSHLSHVYRSHHPLPLREQAFALHCQGLRSPAISEQLGIPQRTVRAWIAADLKALADEQRATRRQQLALAVERQHQLTATAWHEFESETAVRHALLDALLLVLTTLTGAANAESNDAPARASATRTAPVTLPRLPRLPASTPAPRYLSLVLQANKEINRLLGLHTLARLDLLTPDGPETEPAPLTGSNIPAESATASLSPLRVGAARAEGSDVIGAERAERAAVGPGVGSPEFPAESATAEDGLAAGFGSPANLQSPIPSPSLASASRTFSPLRIGEGLGVGSRFPAKTATSTHRPARRRRRR